MNEFSVSASRFRFTRASVLALVLLAASFGIYGCRKRQVNEAAVDLTGRVSPIGSPKNFERNLDVIRRGNKKDAMVLVAPAGIRASLRGVTGRRTLEFWAAPVFDIGDGFLMMVFINRSGTRFLVEERYFDPGRRAEDRNWIPVAVQLDDIKKGDQVEIELSAGPQGDLTADWLALSSVRLTRSELRN